MFRFMGMGISAVSTVIAWRALMSYQSEVESTNNTALMHHKCDLSKTGLLGHNKN